eukprot:TRINITY_DN7511_c0_g1_i1.p1 TRINITY_DN7511_c0_g1~~TRINITY_DN7511_c0_g1_i1.p1  ORF type:complete len:618 (-),score=114.01 TRINITY_DN7511_c0_g1_i1:22-1875(-)
MEPMELATPFDDLPDDCIHELFSHLGKWEIVQLGLTCKRMQRHKRRLFHSKEQATFQLLTEYHTGFQNSKKYNAWNPKEEEIKCYDWLCDYGCNSFSALNHRQMLEADHFKKHHGVLLEEWLVFSSSCPHSNCRPLEINPPETKSWRESLCEQCGSVVITFEKDDAFSYCERGRRYYCKGAFHKALEDFTQAIKLSPENTSFLCYRGNTLCEMGDFRKALEDFDLSLKINPSPYMYYNSAIILTNLNDLSSAVERYSQAIAIGTNDKDKALYYNNRGNIVSFSEGDDRALEDYTMAIQLDDKHPMFYVNRAAIWMNKKEYQRALEDYSMAILLNPNNPMYYSTRYSCNKAMQDYKAALVDINRAIQLDPDNDEYYVYRSQLHRATGEIELAMANINEGIKRNPKNADALRGKAEIFARLGNFAEATAAATKAVQILPSSWNLYCLAVVHELSKNHKAALMCYSRIIQENPSEIRAYVGRAAQTKQLGMLEESISDLQRIIELEPKLASTYNDLGIIYFEKNQYEKALFYFQEAAREPSEFTDLYLSNCGEVYCKLLRFEEAIPVLRRSLELGNERQAQSSAHTKSLLSKACISLSQMDASCKRARLVPTENSIRCEM